MIAAARANIVLLQQGIDFLQNLGPTRYSERVPTCFNATPGGHLRHIVDHYLGLLDGLECGEVDYEHRARDPLIEADASYAVGVLSQLIDRLEALPTVNLNLRVQAETQEGTWTESSLWRELEFLVSHTIHHYALMAIMSRLLGYVPPADFGMAPSTLKYLQQQRTPAR